MRRDKASGSLIILADIDDEDDGCSMFVDDLNIMFVLRALESEYFFKDLGQPTSGLARAT